MSLGRVDHANLVINVVPRTHRKPVDVDAFASQTLANAKTAEEYVNKAIEMKNKYEYTTPSSSFVKYDVYEGGKTKLIPVISTPSQVTEPMSHKEDLSNMRNSASENSDLAIEHPQEYVHQTYKHPALSAQIKDLDSSNSDFNQNYNFMSTISQNYDPYDSIKHINHDNRHNVDDAMRKLVGYPSKEDMIKYIERAVKKYLRGLEIGGKFQPSSLPPLSGSSSAQAEIKTYYRFPSSTSPSPIESTKLYNLGIHSEFFKSFKGSSSKPSYATVKPFSLDTYSPDGVDLTIPSKKLPKPIDLSALDVGQSWSHSTSSHAEPGVSYRKKKKKPKIHMNSQTHHDINALPYIPNQGLIFDEYSPTSASIIDHPSGSSHYSSLKDHPIGASITFGGNSHKNHHRHRHHGHHGHNHHHSSYSHHDDEKSGFVPSMQVVNGVPVTNPYKFNIETLK